MNCDGATTALSGARQRRVWQSLRQQRRRQCPRSRCRPCTRTPPLRRPPRRCRPRHQADRTDRQHRQAEAGKFDVSVCVRQKLVRQMLWQARGG